MHPPPPGPRRYPMPTRPPDTVLRVEGEPTSDDSIPSLVARLVEDGRQFVRSELGLYRARLLSRADEARNAVIFAVLALSLAQATLVAALVGLLMVLRQPLGPGGATAVVVAAGLAGAGLLAWAALVQVKKAVATKDKDQRP